MYPRDGTRVLEHLPFQISNRGAVGPGALPAEVGTPLWALRSAFGNLFAVPAICDRQAGLPASDFSEGTFGRRSNPKSVISSTPYVVAYKKRRLREPGSLIRAPLVGPLGTPEATTTMIVRDTDRHRTHRWKSNGRSPRCP